MRRPTRMRLLGLALAGTLVGVAFGSAVGQDRDRGEARDERAPDVEEPDAPSGTDEDVSAEASYAAGEGGSKVKVLEFSGLDVSGRLKSPQLVYFLARMRAEFDRPRLPHRSFLPEMERSTHDESF